MSGAFAMSIAFASTAGAQNESAADPAAPPAAAQSAQPNTTPVTPQTVDNPNPASDEVAPPFADTPAGQTSDVPQPGEVTPPALDNGTPADSAAGAATDRFPNTDTQRDARTFRNDDRRDGRDPQAGRTPRSNFDPGFQVWGQTGQPLMIGTVPTGGLAAQAGLRADDRIISIDGRTFTTPSEFQDFAPQLAGRRVPIIVERDGQQQTVSIEYPTAAQSDSVASSRGWLGVYLSPSFSGNGARVSRLATGSPAARAGLRTGDIIVGLNGRDVWNYHDLVDGVTGLSPNSTAELNVMRNGRTVPLVATVAAVQRAGYRGDGYQRGYDADGYGRRPAPPTWNSGSNVGATDRLDRLEQMVIELQTELRSMRHELSQNR